MLKVKNKMILLPLFLLLVAAIFWGIFFWEGEKEFDKKVNEYTEREINGSIIKTTKLDRGFHWLVVRENRSDTTFEYKLPRVGFLKRITFR